MQIAQKRKALKKTKIDFKRTIDSESPKVQQLKATLQKAKGRL